MKIELKVETLYRFGDQTLSADGMKNVGKIKKKSYMK